MKLKKMGQTVTPFNAIEVLLKNRGVKISRRTIAKYRDELEIPSSTMRKKY
mgnify:CR=1 FL=1